MARHLTECEVAFASWHLRKYCNEWSAGWPRPTRIPWPSAEADLTLLLAKNGEAWEKYGQFYEGWTLEEVAELLEAVRAAS